MLSHSTDPANHLLEVTINGKITRDDFVNLINTIETPLAEWSDIRVLKRIDKISGIEFGALVEDFKFAWNNFKHIKKVKKVAVVTNLDWLENVSEALAGLFSIEVKVFEQDEMDQARSWLK